MKSHTVPRRLLQQFTYPEASTKSPRLWRYEKGSSPYSKASPTTATRLDGHFAHPSEGETEARIETRLAYEIEDPVNQFIGKCDEMSFSLSNEQRYQMTRYITLLFNRSQARRAATRHLEEITVRALNSFLSNESQLLTVAAHWNFQSFSSNRRLSRLVTTADVAKSARDMAEFHKSPQGEQQSYVESIGRALSTFDKPLFDGQWNLVRTTPNDPFILSDTPVVTWQRSDSGQAFHGGGFSRANVEVFLPLSPLACLHILPAVGRTNQVVQPTVKEVNTAQAAFAYRSCFANQYSAEIDEIVQTHVSTARIGENVFTLWHRNFDKTFFELLIKTPNRWPKPYRPVWQIHSMLDW
jgi:Protein of unknown function (DUF4238)